VNRSQRHSEYGIENGFIRFYLAGTHEAELRMYWELTTETDNTSPLFSIGETAMMFDEYIRFAAACSSRPDPTMLPSGCIMENSIHIKNKVRVIFIH